MAKIYIFSGDDNVSSRNAFVLQIENFKKENREIEILPAKDINPEVLENILGSNDLFGSVRCLATENFFSGKSSKMRDSLIEKLLTFKDAVLIDWEEKEISKTEANKLGNNLILKNFKLPNVLFKFLDSISPKNKTENLILLKKILETNEAEFIFLMIIRQVRLLILVLDKQTEDLLPWQKNNLENQAKCFSKEQLKNLYKQLLEIDLKQKTSQSPFDLSAEIEIMIASL